MKFFAIAAMSIKYIIPCTLHGVYHVETCPKIARKKKKKKFLLKNVGYKFLAHDNYVHKSHAKIFIDGSKTSNGEELQLLNTKHFIKAGYLIMCLYLLQKLLLYLVSRVY